MPVSLRVFNWWGITNTYNVGPAGFFSLLTHGNGLITALIDSYFEFGPLRYLDVDNRCDKSRSGGLHTPTTLGPRGFSRF